MHQVDKHSEMLYEMDTKMTIMNKTIQYMMQNINTLRYETNMLHFFQNKLYTIYCCVIENCMLVNPVDLVDPVNINQSTGRQVDIPVDL